MIYRSISFDFLKLDLLKRLSYIGILELQIDGHRLGPQVPAIQRHGLPNTCSIEC
jgi:hypothetical protein